MNILVIEEDRSVLEDIREMLENNFRNISVVEPPADFDICTLLSRSDSPRIVMIDVDNESVDGLAMIPKIVSSSGVSVIVISSLGHPPDRLIDALEKGASDYLLKPILKNDLVHTVRDLLREVN